MRWVAVCVGGGSATVVRTVGFETVTVLLMVAQLLMIRYPPGAWSASRPALPPGPRARVARPPSTMVRQTLRLGFFCSALLLMVASLLVVWLSRRLSGAEDLASGP